MQPQESVMMWYTRILAVGDNIVANDTVGITDPSKLAIIQGQRETLDLLLMDQFKRGLKDTIRAQMRTENFTNIEACARAAEEAEEFLEATTTQVNFVGSMQEKSCAAMSSTAVGQVQKMNGRAPVGAGVGSGQRSFESGPGKFAHVKCYNCSKKGHYANHCPEPPKKRTGFKNGEKGNKGYAKGGNNSESESEKDTNAIFSDNIAQLSEKMEKMCAFMQNSQSNSRSRKAKRQSSSERSRDSSRSRSSSKNRKHKSSNHTSKVSYKQPKNA
jgi:hypothetical protein